jgi:hypothetical protein
VDIETAEYEVEEQDRNSKEVITRDLWFLDIEEGVSGNQEIFTERTSDADPYSQIHG